LGEWEEQTGEEGEGKPLLLVTVPIALVLCSTKPEKERREWPHAHWGRGGHIISDA